MNMRFVSQLAYANQAPSDLGAPSKRQGYGWQAAEFSSALHAREDSSSKSNIALSLTRRVSQKNLFFCLLPNHLTTHAS